MLHIIAYQICIIGLAEWKNIFHMIFDCRFLFCQHKGELVGISKSQCFYPLIHTDVSINQKIPECFFSEMCVEWPE